jgi:hypothetical protein
VLTHADGRTLGRTLRSFIEHVTPEPTQTIVYRDGKLLEIPDDVPRGRVPLGDLVFTASFEQKGFCGATKELWMLASKSDADYVFWLEHDFVFTRDVDLTKLAGTLDRNHHLAQIALMRDAVNAEEKAAGGLYELRRESYQHVTGRQGCYMTHSNYFTTNPSLMPRDFMRAHPWPDYADQCEGRFGIDLRNAGYRFGVWGSGEPWMTHIGLRYGGFGY